INKFSCPFCSVSDSEKKPTFFSLFRLRSASFKPYISFTHKTQHHLCTFPSKLCQINATVSPMFVSLFTSPFGKARKMFRKDDGEQRTLSDMR
ncbi:hypothetical protein VIGAN_08204900, partial [Vigna angularis var. angularis]